MTDQRSDQDVIMERKRRLRRAVIARRAAMAPADRAAARAAIVDWVLAVCPTQGPVAAYLPLATEPGSVQLLTALDAAGHEVLVPLTEPDRDLDWCTWVPSTAPNGAGADATPMLGPALGKNAVARAALILVPAFAVDLAGNRLGRGGGSYDRALGRISPGARTAALLFRDELVAAVPVQSWDVGVQAVITPAGALQTPIPVEAIRQRNT